MLSILQFIQSTVWKMLVGNSSSSLEKSVEQEDEFMIIEKAPLVNAFISTASAPCNCAAFTAASCAASSRARASRRASRRTSTRTAAP